MRNLIVKTRIFLEKEQNSTKCVSSDGKKQDKEGVNEVEGKENIENNE